MADQSDAVRWYRENVIGKHNTYSHAPGGLRGRFAFTGPGKISTDCSGSTYAAYNQACGIEIGMDCGALATKTGRWVDQPNSNPHKPNLEVLIPGDLLLFRGGTPGRPFGSSHVEIYMGDGKCAGCGSTKVVKEYSCTSPYWSNIYIGAKRVIEGGQQCEPDPNSQYTNQFAGMEGSWDSTLDGNMGFEMQEEYDPIGELVDENLKFKKLWDMYRRMFYRPGAGGELMNLSNMSEIQYNGETITYDGIVMTRAYLDLVHKQETGLPFGQLTDKLIKGVDIGDARGAKTYGAGLLYDPYTSQLMDKTRAAQGRDFTKSELDDRFLKTYANAMKKAEKAVGRTLAPNQREALSSMIGLYGHVIPGVKQAIQRNDMAALKHAWLHGHDNDSKYPKYRNGWNKRSMWEYLWFTGVYYPGTQSAEVAAATKAYFG